MMTSYINPDPEHEEENSEPKEDSRPERHQQLLEQVSGELCTCHLITGQI